VKGGEADGGTVMRDGCAWKRERCGEQKIVGGEL
jgi:hypothetical protein